MEDDTPDPGVWLITFSDMLLLLLVCFVLLASMSRLQGRDEQQGVFGSLRDKFSGSAHEPVAGQLESHVSSTTPLAKAAQACRRQRQETLWRGEEGTCKPTAIWAVATAPQSPRVAPTDTLVTTPTLETAEGR